MAATPAPVFSLAAYIRGVFPFSPSAFTLAPPAMRAFTTSDAALYLAAICNAVKPPSSSSLGITTLTIFELLVIAARTSATTSSRTALIRSACNTSTDGSSTGSFSRLVLQADRSNISNKAKPFISRILNIIFQDLSSFEQASKSTVPFIELICTRLISWTSPPNKCMITSLSFLVMLGDNYAVVVKKALFVRYQR